MGCFAFINVYTLRVNLSVALVEMVNTTYLRELETHAALSDDNNTKPHAVCPSDGVQCNETIREADVSLLLNLS